MTPNQKAALQELSFKSLVQIQIETARTWAHRAWAAKAMAQMASDRGDTIAARRFDHDSTEYEHEALEHAALSGDNDVLDAVRDIIAAPL